MTSMKIVQFSRPPSTTPCLATSKILPPPLPWTSNFKRTPSPHPVSFPNDNQSVKRKHNSWRTIICYQVFPSGRLSFSVPAQ